MRFVAWFDIAVGAAIAGLWTMLLATRQIPEIAEGRTDIWFHITAELVTAALPATKSIRLNACGSATSSRM